MDPDPRPRIPQSFEHPVRRHEKLDRLLKKTGAGDHHLHGRRRIQKKTFLEFLLKITDIIGLP